MVRASLLLVGLSLFTVACESEVGECNIAEARRIAYAFSEGSADTGLPAYEGQAIMQRSCGGGSGICHSSSASGGARSGAPAGLDFHLEIACELGADGQCPEAQRPNFERLQLSVDQTFEHARSILAEVDAETMPPPGPESDDVRELSLEYFRGGSSATFDPISGGDQPLPELETPEGREILRNWLACGAPVIGAVRPADGREPGESCGVMVEVGDCLVRHDPPPPPEPNWDSIYAFFATSCVAGCHDSMGSEGALEIFDQSKLDLRDKETAHAELLAEGEGDHCGGMGPLVVPNMPDSSILIDKLKNQEPSCGGEPMPQGRLLLPEEYLQPIEEWIMNGATE